MRRAVPDDEPSESCPIGVAGEHQPDDQGADQGAEPAASTRLWRLRPGRARSLFAADPVASIVSTLVGGCGAKPGGSPSGSRSGGRAGRLGPGAVVAWRPTGPMVAGTGRRGRGAQWITDGRRDRRLMAPCATSDPGRGAHGDHPLGPSSGRVMGALAGPLRTLDPTLSSRPCNHHFGKSPLRLHRIATRISKHGRALVGADPEVSWTTTGCRRATAGTIPPAMFFPSDGVGVEIARKLCESCPVKQPCLEYALAERVDHGVWGGCSERAASGS